MCAIYANVCAASLKLDLLDDVDSLLCHLLVARLIVMDACDLVNNVQRIFMLYT